MSEICKTENKCVSDEERVSLCCRSHAGVFSCEESSDMRDLELRMRNAARYYLFCEGTHALASLSGACTCNESKDEQCLEKKKKAN
jgi:hypothetical protein